MFCACICRKFKFTQGTFLRTKGARLPSRQKPRKIIFTSLHFAHAARDKRMKLPLRPSTALGLRTYISENKHNIYTHTRTRANGAVRRQAHARNTVRSNISARADKAHTRYDAQCDGRFAEKRRTRASVTEQREQTIHKEVEFAEERTLAIV